MRGLLVIPLILLILAGGCDTTPGPTAEVVIEDLAFGTGPQAQTGDTLQLHYEGRLAEDSTVFDSSRQRGQPDTLILGRGLVLDGKPPQPVIDGWEQGIPGMRAGGLRRLIVPPELAYGQRGAGCDTTACVIPPDATLIFDIELLAINP